MSEIIVTPTEILEGPPKWHRWLGIALTSPLRLVLLFFGLLIGIMDGAESGDFRDLWPMLKRIAVEPLNEKGDTGCAS